MVSAGLRRYRAFGLEIASQASLDPYLEGAPSATVPPDLVVILDAPPAGRGPRDIELDWPGAGRVLVRDGREVWVLPEPSVAPKSLAEYIASPLLAVVLEQRGEFILHASTVALDVHRAVAFTGVSGAGKSTTAAVLAGTGALMSDDIAPLRVTGSAVATVAGPTLAKLDAEVVAGWPGLLGVGREALGDKSLFQWADRLRSGESRQLVALYRVVDGPSVEVVPLTGGDAAATLLTGSFCLDFGGTRRQAGRLREAAAIGRHVKVRALRRPRTVEASASILEAIVDDVAGLERAR
jgi:energy-coupling factor transporter ATP-binding protein EcfA2